MSLFLLAALSAKAYNFIYRTLIRNSKLLVNTRWLRIFGNTGTRYLILDEFFWQMELNSNIVVFEVFEDLFMFPWLFRKFCQNDKIPVFDCWGVKRRMRNSRKHCRDSLEPKRLRIRNTKNNVFTQMTPGYGVTLTKEHRSPTCYRTGCLLVCTSLLLMF